MSEEREDENRVAVTVAGMPVEWDLEAGQNLWGGAPSVCFFIHSSMLGLMSGFQKMVGAERFNLALQAEGRNSVEEDWRMITSQPSFEEGFYLHGRAAAAAGWGRWELIRLDRDRPEALFRVHGC